MYLPSAGAMSEQRQSWLTNAASSLLASFAPSTLADRKHRIEERVAAQPQSFQLDVQPIALFQLDGEVIDIFALHDAADGDLSGNRLAACLKLVFGSISATSGKLPTVNVRRLLTPPSERMRNGVDAQLGSRRRRRSSPSACRLWPLRAS